MLANTIFPISKEIIQSEYQKNIETFGNPVFSRVFLCLGFIIGKNYKNSKTDRCIRIVYGYSFNEA